MKRIIAVLAIVSLFGLSLSTATAASKPRLPNSAVDWATFSASERAAALDYVWQELQNQLAAGTAIVHTVGRTGAGALAEAVTPDTVTTTVDWNCPIQWIDLPEGSWTRGGGCTDTSASVYYIAASRIGMEGQFLRDGLLLSNWYNVRYNDSHAENWTGYNWKWWYESFNFVNKGWHSAQLTNGGSWLIHDQYCTVSVYR